MVKACLFVEGGGDDAALNAGCREGFRKLLLKSGFGGKMPRITASGSRQQTLRDFATAHEQGAVDYVALLVDSEDPVSDIEKPWDHLTGRTGENMVRPEGAKDDQAFLMATCMETWIVSDPSALGAIYRGGCLQESALPPTVSLEDRHRDDIQSALERATRKCPNRYVKGRRSFRTLAELRPEVLRSRLPSFGRMERILNQKLKEPLT